MSRPIRQWGRSHGAMWLLEPTLLLLLHFGEAHGYTLIEQLEDYGLGNLQSSIIYRTLREMEASGWVTSSWDPDGKQGPPRRVYRLSELGNDILKDYVEDLERAQSRIGGLIEAYRRHIREDHSDTSTSITRDP